MGATYYDGQKVEAAYYNGYATTAYYNGVKIWPSTTVYKITLLSDAGGTLEANTLTGHYGDVVTLTPTHKDYYRFYQYASTGIDNISNNSFVLTSDCTASAQFPQNVFTAKGTFFTPQSTARYGYFMPAKVTAISIPYGDGSDVSAHTLYQYGYRADPATTTWATVSLIGLTGTHSAVSGSVASVGSSYRRSGNGTYNFSMRQYGPYAIYDITNAAGPTAAGKWGTKSVTNAFKTASWTIGTAVSYGNGNTLSIAAWKNWVSAYTTTTGSWTMTGIAK